MSKKTFRDRNLKFETLQLHVGQEQPDPATDARAVPIYATSSYVFHNSDHAAARFSLQDAGNIYGRLTNPTQEIFEQRIAALEGGAAALAVASGAAAVTYTIQNLARSGEHIVAANNIYGGSYNLLQHTLPEYGITATFADPSDVNSFAQAIQECIRLCQGRKFAGRLPIESAAVYNDSAKGGSVASDKFRGGMHHNICAVFYGAYQIWCCKGAVYHQRNLMVMGNSGNRFNIAHIGMRISKSFYVNGPRFDWEASGKFPSLTEPNASYHGVSFTKAAGPAAFVTKIRAVLLRDTGAALSPFHAFLFLQGLETLSLRVERHVANALKTVEYLNSHPQVEKVHHPSVAEDPKQQELYRKYFPKGGGSIFTFEIKGDDRTAKDFIDHLESYRTARKASSKSSIISSICSVPMDSRMVFFKIPCSFAFCSFSSEKSRQWSATPLCRIC